MEVNFSNQNEVFNKILTNPVPTHAYKENEKSRRNVYLRPVLAFCAIAIIVGTISFLNQDKLFVTFDNSNNMAETVEYTTKNAANFSCKDIYIDEETGLSLTLNNIGSALILAIPEGYEYVGAKIDETSFEYEYKNQNGDFILYTNLVSINTKPLANAEIDGETVYIIANAITKEDAEKILSAVVDN